MPRVLHELQSEPAGRSVEGLDQPRSEVLQRHRIYNLPASRSLVRNVGNAQPCRPVQTPSRRSFGSSIQIAVTYGVIAPMLRYVLRKAVPACFLGACMATAVFGQRYKAEEFRNRLAPFVTAPQRAVDKIIDM